MLGRHGTSKDPAWANRRRLLRGRERLSDQAYSRMWEEILAQDATGELLATWIAKEELRFLLSLARTRPPRSEISNRLFAFYDWCTQNDDIPELLSLARTVTRWEDEIICAVLTGVTNAASESLNRLAKLEARLAYGFRNPANQRRRVRIACTRGRRRKSRTATSNRTHAVTGPKPHPG